MNSLTEGLNPKEFSFYAMSGREGICDTAMGTSVSGYIQRKLVKLMEDLQVQHDYTVRDSNNDIIQFSYGDNSIACNKMVLIKTPTDEQNNEGKTIYKKKTYLMDVNNLVERINLDYELENDTFNLKNIIQFIIQDIFKNNINDRKSLIQSLQENQTFNFTFNRHVKYINNLIDLFFEIKNTKLDNVDAYFNHFNKKIQYKFIYTQNIDVITNVINTYML